MNFIPAFYEQIMARIKANILTDGNTPVSAIKHVDLFFNQYSPNADGEFGELPFNRPAMFIEWQPLDMVTLGNKRQATEGLIILHLVEDVEQEVDSNTHSSIRNLGHAHMDLIDKTHKAFQGWNGNVPASGFKNFGSFDRKGISNYEAQGLMMVHKLTYRTRVIDNFTTTKFKNPKNYVPAVTVTDTITPDIL